MTEVLAIAMVLTAGLFAGGVLSIAWERVPAWKSAEPSEFQATFAHTLRRVDRLQPALLTVCLVSTIGFALSVGGGAARTLSLLAAAGLLIVLVGSVALLVPAQRRLVASASRLTTPDVERLRTRWLRGHVLRTGVALAALVLVVAAVVA
jgi:hypothetical protein